MADAKFKATLPKDNEANGLAGADWNRRLLTNVEEEYVAIVTFRAVDQHGLPGHQVAYAGFTRFEPVTDEAVAEKLRQQLQGIAAERRGLTQLPIEEPVAPVEGPELDLETPLEEQAEEEGNVTAGPWEPDVDDDTDGGDAA